MSAPSVTGVLWAFADLSPSVRQLQIRMTGGSRFHFLPGQYVSVRIPVRDRRPLHCAYSIACAPNAANRLELCFKHDDHGTAGTYLMQRGIGDRLEMVGPAGRFILQRPVRRDLAFIATGTGVTPIRAMLQSLFLRGTRRRVALLFGARRASDLLFRAEFEALARRHANFRFLPVLSRPGGDWEGLRGYVQEQVRETLCGQTRPETYVCGVAAMVREVRHLLQECGIPADRIHYERYDA